jgi:hypothetical protein
MTTSQINEALLLVLRVTTEIDPGDDEVKQAMVWGGIVAVHKAMRALLGEEHESTVAIGESIDKAMRRTVAAEAGECADGPWS